MLPKLTEMERNGIMFTPLWFYQKLSTDLPKMELSQVKLSI